MNAYGRAREYWKPLRRLGYWLADLLLIAMGGRFCHYVDDKNFCTDVRYAATQDLLGSVRKSLFPLYPKRTALVFVDAEDDWTAALAGRSPIKRDDLASRVACRRVTITRLLASKLSWLLAAKSCSPSNSNPT
jgi:hypothetical protein